MRHGPKKDTVEEKLLEIIQQPEHKPDEEELFCLSLAAKLRKIKDPKKREYAQMQLQQTLFNCMYGDALQPQPQPQPQPQLQPQPQPQLQPQLQPQPQPQPQLQASALSFSLTSPTTISYPYGPSTKFFFIRLTKL